MDPSVEQYEESIRTLKGALKACVDAMHKGLEEGCVDHLDCCDDAGAFWHDAYYNAKKLL